MATKTFYFLNAAAATPNWFGNLQDGGSAPSAALSGYGWTVAKGATSVPFWRMRAGSSAPVASGNGQASSYIASTSGPTKGTGATNTTAGDSFISPTTYSGGFASGNWTFNFGLRTSVITAVGRMRLRVWASINADGTSARELTSSVQVGNIITLSATGSTQTSTITWTAPTVTLANEYLFIQPEWETTTAGTQNTTNVFFYQSAGTIVTTNFVPGKVLVAAGTPSYALTGATTTKLVIPRIPAEVTGLFSMWAAPCGPYLLEAGTYSAINLTTHTNANANQSLDGVTGSNAIGQTVTIGSANIVLSKVRSLMYETGSPTGNVYCEVHDTTPTGTLIATSDNVDVSVLTATAAPGQMVEFTFSTPPTLTASAVYALVFRRSVADASNYVRFMSSSVNAYAGGTNWTSTNGTSFSAGSQDLWLQLWASTTTTSDTYYAVGVYNADNWYLVASKASDPRADWGNFGIAVLVQTGAAVFDVSCFRVGSVLHIAAATNHVSVVYTTFDMATETWGAAGTVESVHANFDPTTSTSQLFIITSIVVRSDGSVIVAYQGPRASTFSRVGYKIRSTAGVWGTYTELSAAGSINYTDPEVILDPDGSDRVFFMHRNVTTIAMVLRVLTLGGSLQAARGPHGLFCQYGWNPHAVTFHDDPGGWPEIFMPGWDSTRGLSGITWEGGSDTPSVFDTTLSVVGTVDSPTRAFVDGGDVWVIYNHTTNLDLYIAKSTDNGQTFSGHTVAFGVTAALLQEQRGGYVMSQNGEVYIRGGNYVVPYFVQTDSQTKLYYNENIIRSASANKTLTATGNGVYTLTPGATVLLTKAGKYAPPPFRTPSRFWTRRINR